VKTEDSKDVKSKVKHETTDSNPAAIKQKIKAEASMSTNSVVHTGDEQADIKPGLTQLSAHSGPSTMKREGLSPPLKQEPGKS